MGSGTHHSSREPAPAAAKTALIIAHPGHELCVYGWLKQNRPSVFVLTDGSAPSRPPRLDTLTKRLTGLGLATGEFYGVTTDAEVYRALLAGDVQFFSGLALRLSNQLLEEGVTLVVGEAAEGYSPTHDVMRAVTGAAVEHANRERAERPIAHYEFNIIRRQDACAPVDSGVVSVRLDDVTFGEKIAAMRACPELTEEVGAGLDGASLDSLKPFASIADEVGRVVGDLGGAEGFRVECLRPVTGSFSTHFPDEYVPFYERYGEVLAALGRYAEVIRYREHYLPVVKSLEMMPECVSARGRGQDASGGA
jgi:hypothetical protein